VGNVGGRGDLADGDRCELKLIAALRFSLTPTSISSWMAILKYALPILR
jgi:hypothetical protein